MKRFAILLLLTGCAVGPDHTPPAPEAPAAWHTALQDEALPSETRQWWKAFGDAKLDELVERALAHNRDLKIAQARIKEARGSRQSTASALYPQLQGSARGTRTEAGFPSSAFGAAQGAAPGIGAGAIPSFDKPIDISEAGFDASWEIDLFGGTRRKVEAASAAIASREAGLREISITLVGDVTRNYIEWRQLQQQSALAQATATAQQRLFELTRQRFEAGLASRFELSQAETLATTAAARLPEWERRRAASGYRLSVLLGENAGALNDELNTPAILPSPINLPSLAAPAEILRRRPDVEAAERDLAAATALQGAAIAELFPKLSLSALFGIQDTSLGDASRVWSAGAGAVVPLLNFGRIQGGINQAEARQQQAFFAYQKTVLVAVSEIETALSDIARGRERVEAQQSAAESAAKTVELARLRFTQGVSAFTDVLTSEQQYYGARDELIQAQAALLNAIIALHKALGIAVSSS